MKLSINEIGVKVKITEGKLKAIISLDFGDFTVKGFRVQESQYENARGQKLWLTPPSYRAGNGTYHPIFFVPDKKLWQTLEEKIWDAYDEAYKSHYAKVYDLTDEDADQFLSPSA